MFARALCIILLDCALTRTVCVEDMCTLQIRQCTQIHICVDNDIGWSRVMYSLAFVSFSAPCRFCCSLFRPVSRSFAPCLTPIRPAIYDIPFHPSQAYVSFELNSGDEGVEPRVRAAYHDAITAHESCSSSGNHSIQGEDLKDKKGTSGGAGGERGGGAAEAAGGGSVGGRGDGSMNVSNMSIEQLRELVTLYRDAMDFEMDRGTDVGKLREVRYILCTHARACTHTLSLTHT